MIEAKLDLNKLKKLAEKSRKDLGNWPEWKKNSVDEILKYRIERIIEDE